MSIRIYHNPKCGTSRKALELLQAKGLNPEVIEYLKTPLSAAELRELLKMLGLTARQLLRANEQLNAELGLADKARSEAELIEAMATHPILMQRPVVVLGNRAFLARPAERVLEILQGQSA